MLKYDDEAYACILILVSMLFSLNVMLFEWLKDRSYEFVFSRADGITDLSSKFLQNATPPSVLIRSF